MFLTKKTTQHQTGQSITLGIRVFDVVKDFIYLGTQITSDNNISAEIRRRITLASRCLYGLSKLQLYLRSKMLIRTIKLKQYNTLVVPVLIYEAEAWTLTDSDEKMLDLFERKVLRMIYWPVCIEGEWRTRYNHELYLLYGEATVTRKIRTSQMAGTSR